jgi:chondroitin 4-sulfotransferase 11
MPIDSKIGILGDLSKKVSRLKTMAKHKLVGFDYQPNGIILHPYQAIYIPVPKVACSSLKRVCARLLDIDTSSVNGTHSIVFPIVKGAEISQFNNYWKFCFVRNPWDRMLSCFTEKIKEDENFSEPTNSFVNGVHKGLLKYGIFKANMSFEDFLMAIASIPDPKADTHFRSQYTFVTNLKGQLMVDFIGKFENLNEDWSEICDRLKVTDGSLPHYNKTKHNNYREYYTDSLIKIVEQRFAKDIAMFDYKF